MRQFFITLFALTLAASTLLFGTASAKIYGGCGFDSNTLAFAGNVEQQTACLLRKVKPKGSGSVPQEIPDWLKSHAGLPMDLTAAKAKKYLQSNNILESDLGGEVTLGDSSALKYFVIHDTSYPEVIGTFPANIDKADYIGNKFSIWSAVRRKVHLIVSRDGRSHTFNNWNAARLEAGIKIETKSRVPKSRKVFAHVENVQPRIKPPSTFAWIAPDPGFSAEQEQRLALVYVIASIRAGHWLIPAYHFNIDQGLPNGHDDPQNTDLGTWVSKVKNIADQISLLTE